VQSGRGEFASLRRLGRTALGFYLAAAVGCAVECVATGSPSFWDRPAGILSFAAGAVLYAAGIGGLLGWALSPGGFRYIYAPFAIVLGRWPRGTGPPFVSDALLQWNSCSSVWALLIAALHVAIDVAGAVITARSHP